MPEPTPGVQLTHSQAVNRLREIETELSRLTELDALAPEDERYFTELGTDFDKVDAHRKKLERDAELARVKSATEGLNGLRMTPVGGDAPAGRSDYDRDAILEPDSVEDHRFKDPWNLDEVRSFGRDADALNAEFRARALGAIEKMPVANDKVREAATYILEHNVDHSDKLARQILLTSSPAYMRAWSKMARSTPNLITPDEARAMQDVENFRAMSLTDSAGGYLVPFQLDPTVIITSAGSRNDIRSKARQVVATGDVWNGVSSGEVSWGWSAEAAESGDDATTFGSPSIQIHKADGFVPISVEAHQDAANVSQEVGRLFAKGKDTLEAVAFATGSGTGQPFGLVTALAGTASEINAAADDTFAIGDVRALYNALPSRHRAAAAWLANNSTYTTIRGFDTSGGGGFWANLNGDRPEQLLGRDVLEAEAMDGVVNTSGAVSNHILAFGDFENYVIADRIGMTVEFIPHLFGGSGRPTGQRGWWAYYRVGADSLLDDAFRLLDVASAA